MKIITLIYIFSLYVLLSPGVFNKTSLTFENCLLFSLIFSIIFFFTINLVDKKLENYEQQVSLQMSGLDNLVDLIKTRQKNQEMNIDIENQIKGAEDDGAKCWNALGKTQKDIEVLRLQLDSYDGNWETIQKLNQTIIDYQSKIATLKTQLGAYENDESEINQLMVHLSRYQAQLSALEKQVAAFTNTDSDLTNLQSQYDNMIADKDKLLLDYSECDKLTPNLVGSITAYNDTISNNNTTITALQDKFNANTQSIQGIKNTMFENDKTINELENIFNNTKSSCGKKLKFIFVIGSNKNAQGDKLNKLYLTYNNNRVTNVAELSGKNFKKGSQYSVELTTSGNNELINGLYVDVGNNGMTISTIAIEILVNGRWERLTFVDGSGDHYNLPGNWIKNRSEQFTFGTISISPSIWFYNPEHAKQEDHQNHAQKYGGNLASFHSAEELNSVISKFNNKASCWIGGLRKSRVWDFFTRITRSNIGDSSEWEWYDGSSWDYTNWHSGEPNNYTEGGVQLYHGGTWNDAGQGHKIPGLYKLTTPRISIPGSIKLFV